MILVKLLRLPEFQKAKTVLFYASFDGEVETFEMIKQAVQLGKIIALPTVIRQAQKLIATVISNPETDLEKGPHGILQAKPGRTTLEPDDLDLAIVPGVAFDRNNYRLGRGGGFYDRFLVTLPERIPTIGLAFDFQIVDTLPREDHDKAVSHVLTN
jgi:5-formyltetrahydrofolate cyclo-ligase